MNWSDAATQIKAFQAANPNQPRCLLISAGDIAALNAQIAAGMNAIRMYLGQDANGVITGFFIGCINNTSGGFDDYNIPANQQAWNNAINSGTLPLKKDARPCPVICGASNYLNS